MSQAKKLTISMTLSTKALQTGYSLPTLQTPPNQLLLKLLGGCFTTSVLDFYYSDSYDMCSLSVLLHVGIVVLHVHFAKVSIQTCLDLGAHWHFVHVFSGSESIN